MDVKITFRSDALPGQPVSFALEESELRCDILDTIVKRKTQEFLDLINSADPNALDVPPAYQLPVMRGRIRR